MRPAAIRIARITPLGAPLVREIEPKPTPAEHIPQFGMVPGLTARTTWESATRDQLTALAAVIAGDEYWRRRTWQGSQLPATPANLRVSIIGADGQTIAASTAARSPEALRAAISSFSAQIADLEKRRNAMFQLAAIHNLSSQRDLGQLADLSHTQVGRVQRDHPTSDTLVAVARDLLGDSGIPVDPIEGPGVRLFHGHNNQVSISAAEAFEHKSPDEHRDEERLVQHAVAVLESAGISIAATQVKAKAIDDPDVISYEHTLNPESVITWPTRTEAADQPPAQVRPLGSHRH